jgi:transcriptional regulator with XRE-family HTH domain
MPRKISDPVNRHVGGRVRMRRLMLDMSQTVLADSLGVTFQQVQKYEKGTNRVSASRLQHMCQVLQVPVSFFFDGAPTASVARTGAQGAVVDYPTASYVNEFLASSDGRRW